MGRRGRLGCACPSPSFSDDDDPRRIAPNLDGGLDFSETPLVEKGSIRQASTVSSIQGLWRVACSIEEATTAAQLPRQFDGFDSKLAYDSEELLRIERISIMDKIALPCEETSPRALNNP